MHTVEMEQLKGLPHIGDRITDKGEIFCRLVHMATEKGITVKFAPLKAYDGRLKGNRIAIRQELPTIEDFNYNLAHELAHAYLHYDKGNTIDSREHVQYEEQADRAAKMLLTALMGDLDHVEGNEEKREKNDEN